MRLAIDIPDADLPSVSAQFKDRTPPLVDEDGDRTESDADHVTRAITEWIDGELVAATKRAADARIGAATDDTELASALLARSKL
jgi:hypothetical protein